ncbi:glycosyltransferase [Hymenobacter sp. HDW8]|uniref:glycosyltransferase n=1 Tax=Hymenobacter sp. HDW8 TaxID=2714932 RepID=UPI001F0E3A91|nr:glycosyltransferase [Hymenobacter sp. HDW8]
MKLLHLVASMDPRLGGVSQAVRTLIESLAERGVANEVATLDAPQATWIQKDSFLLHALGPGQGPWSYGPRLMPWLLANLARFDAVLLHGLWLYPGYAVRRARRLQAHGSKQSKVPKLFVMPHGMLDPYFQRASGRRLKAWRNWLYWKLIEGAVIHDAHALLFTCETERRLAHQPFSPYHPRRERVVGLGVAEPPAYTPAMQAAFLAACPALQNRSYILFLGRIDHKKGVDLLVQAYASVLAAAVVHPERAHLSLPVKGTTQTEVAPNPALVIVGPGLDTPFGRHVQQLAGEHMVAGDIHFSGMLTGDAKWGLFMVARPSCCPVTRKTLGLRWSRLWPAGSPCSFPSR